MNGESYRLRKVTATENKVEKYIHLWGTPSSGIRIQYTKGVFRDEHKFQLRNYISKVHNYMPIYNIEYLYETKYNK